MEYSSLIDSDSVFAQPGFAGLPFGRRRQCAVAVKYLRRGAGSSAMSKPDPPIELVPCEICMKEVPKSEAIVPEACDYVAYFCGLECYAQWRHQLPEKVAQPESASSPVEPAASKTPG